jgi:RNA polymerase sigma-70 factor (ECF subfamily)
MERTEAELIQQAQAGDREAFGVLVKRYAARAIGAATLMLRNEADALDASQDAFVKAWRNIGRFQGRSGFYTWYSAILRNACLDRIRRRKRRETVELPDEHPDPDTATDPVQLADRNEQTERLWTAIQQLSTKHRDVIVLNHIQGLKYREIAEMLEIPIGTLMSRLHAARKALRERIARNEKCPATSTRI